MFSGAVDEEQLDISPARGFAHRSVGRRADYINMMIISEKLWKSRKNCIRDVERYIKDKHWLHGELARIAPSAEHQTFIIVY